MYNPQLLTAEHEYRTNLVKAGVRASRHRRRARNLLVRWMTETDSAARRELPPNAAVGDRQLSGSRTARARKGRGDGVTQTLIDDLADGVLTDGIARHEAEVAAVADQASVLGVSMTLVDVLIDQAAPEIVRLRAFGSVTRQLATLLGCAEASTQTPAPASSRPVRVAVPA